MVARRGQCRGGVGADGVGCLGWWGCVLLGHVPPHGMDVSLCARVTIPVWSHPPGEDVTVLTWTCPSMPPCHMSPSWDGRVPWAVSPFMVMPPGPHVTILAWTCPQGHMSPPMDMYPESHVTILAWTCPTMPHVTIYGHVLPH